MRAMAASLVVRMHWTSMFGENMRGLQSKALLLCNTKGSRSSFPTVDRPTQQHGLGTRNAQKRAPRIKFQSENPSFC